jgi:acyl dehydratase
MSYAPYFEDLVAGQIERSAPAVTLTDGMAAVHQAIVGDRLRLTLDATLAARVLGTRNPLAHPGLVWDLAIGQSTLFTGRAIANLFYRGLLLKRFPVIGDTLFTSTEVVGLRDTTPREDRPASGLALLRIRTEDQERREILDFWRCAMLPLRDPEGRTPAHDSFEGLPTELDPDALRSPISSWRLEAIPTGHEGLSELRAGMRWRTEAGDVVGSAPELARLTTNLAAVHHDRHWRGARERLVYGGHTVGLAAAQASRLLPLIVTILGWHSCDHLAAVREGDTLYTELELERVEALSGGGALAHLRARVNAVRAPAPAESPAASEALDVLDWRFVALVA